MLSKFNSSKNIVKRIEPKSSRNNNETITRETNIFMPIIERILRQLYQGRDIVKMSSN